MPKRNVALLQWLKHHTPDEKRTLAKRAKTSVPYLEHIAAGRRTASAAFAIRLEQAGGPRQNKICTACARCPYYQ